MFTAEGQPGSDRHGAERPVAQGGPAVAELSPTGQILTISDGYCSLLGRSRADLLGRMMSELEELTEALDVRLLRPDRRTVWVRVVDVETTRSRTTRHAVDVTDLVEARSAVHRTDRRLRALMEHSSDIIAVLDSEGRLLDANPAGERVMGWRVEEKLQSDILDLIHPDDLPHVLHALTDAYSRPGLHAPLIYRIATASGSWIHLESVANNQLADPDVRGVVVNSRDVSEAVQQDQQVLRNIDALVAALGRAVEYRDPYTAGHQAKVADLAVRIARRLGLPEADVRGISLGASLHDIGKIAVPVEVLSRPDRLSAGELEVVMTHCQVGYDILDGIDFSWPVAELVRDHHERLDGSGYPRGLTGDEVSLAARIVGVCDVVDAVSSDRPHRPGLGFAAACEELRSRRGQRYDPDVVDVALSLIGPGASGPES